MTSIAATALADGVVAPTPTFGAGQLYKEERKPDVSGKEGGNEQFGYGQSVENPDVYYVWMTDQNGTHYYTVGADSEQLLGSIDEATSTRRNNGYVHLIEERTEKLEEVSGAENEVNKRQTLRMSSHGGAIGAAVAGGLICGLIAGGACYVAFGVVAVTAWVAGVVQNGEKIAAQDNLTRIEGQLEAIDTKLQDKFSQTMRVEANP